MTFKMPLDPQSYPRKNILTPLLWLNAITFPGAAAAYMYDWQKGLLLLLIALIPLGFTLAYYRMWSKIDPDRLQTEDYRIQREYLTRIVGNIEADESRLPVKNAKLITQSFSGEGE